MNQNLVDPPKSFTKVMCVHHRTPCDEVQSDETWLYGCFMRIISRCWCLGVFWIDLVRYCGIVCLSLSFLHWHFTSFACLLNIKWQHRQVFFISAVRTHIFPFCLHSQFFICIVQCTYCTDMWHLRQQWAHPNVTIV